MTRFYTSDSKNIRKRYCVNKMKKYWYTMMLIGSLIAVKGSSLISRMPGLEIFSDEPAAERLASEADAALAVSVSEENTPETVSVADTAISPSLPQISEIPSSEEEPGNPVPEVPASDPVLAETPPSKEASAPIDFSSTLFIGDSRTEGLKEYGGLNEAEFFANSGMSSFNLLSTRLTVKDGSKVTLEELLSQHNYERIYLMLGINELGYPPSSVTKQYASIVDWIRQLQPQARIILEANLHVTKKKSDSDPVYGNGKIDALNHAIYQMAVEKGCGYTDVNSLFDDGQGNLDSQYSVDNAHIMGKYYTVWAQWLRTQNV